MRVSLNMSSGSGDSVLLLMMFGGILREKSSRQDRFRISGGLRVATHGAKRGEPFHRTILPSQPSVLKFNEKVRLGTRFRSCRVYLTGLESISTTKNHRFSQRFSRVRFDSVIEELQPNDRRPGIVSD